MPWGIPSTTLTKNIRMAAKLQLLVVAALVFALAAVNDSKINMDPETAKNVAKAFEAALMEEEPILKQEEKKAEVLRQKSLVRTHLRTSKDATVPVSISPHESGEWANDFEKDVSDLVMGLSKGGFGATPMGDSVGKIAALIEKDMMPKALTFYFLSFLVSRAWKIIFIVVVVVVVAQAAWGGQGWSVRGITCVSKDY